MKISTEVSASAAAEFASAPPWMPRMPAAPARGRRRPRAPPCRRRRPARRNRPARPRLEQMRRDVLKGRDHARPRARAELRRHRRRAFGRQLHARHLRRHQRHGDIDQDLAAQRVADALERRAMRRIGHGRGPRSRPVRRRRDCPCRSHRCPEPPRASSAAAASARAGSREPMMTGWPAAPSAGRGRRLPGPVPPRTAIVAFMMNECPVLAIRYGKPTWPQLFFRFSPRAARGSKQCPVG